MYIVDCVVGAFWMWEEDDVVEWSSNFCRTFTESQKVAARLATVISAHARKHEYKFSYRLIFLASYHFLLHCSHNLYTWLIVLPTTKFSFTWSILCLTVFGQMCQLKRQMAWYQQHHEEQCQEKQELQCWNYIKQHDPSWLVLKSYGNYQHQCLLKMMSKGQCLYDLLFYGNKVPTCSCGNWMGFFLLLTDPLSIQSNLCHKLQLVPCGKNIIISKQNVVVHHRIVMTFNNHSKKGGSIPGL